MVTFCPNVIVGRGGALEADSKVAPSRPRSVRVVTRPLPVRAPIHAGVGLAQHELGEVDSPGSHGHVRMTFFTVKDLDADDDVRRDADSPKAVTHRGVGLGRRWPMAVDRLSRWRPRTA